MIAVTALALATLSFALDSLALAYVIKTGKALKVSNEPDRPYDPKSPGSNWQPVRKTPTLLDKIKDKVKGKAK